VGGNDHPLPIYDGFFSIARYYFSIISYNSISFYPPINTVIAPGGITVPPEAVISRILAAGNPPISTVSEPFIITSAPQESPCLAAGNPPIKTDIAPGGIIGVGMPEVAGLTIISVTRAAGNISLF
jgi:hypothetical protein